MNHVDYVKLYEQHSDAFKQANTFGEFIALADLNDKQRAFYAKYAGGWADNSFLTHKAHGFMSRPVMLPNARKVTDLFETARLEPYSVSGSHSLHAPEKFISHLRADGFGYFGHLYCDRYIRVRGGKFFTHGVRNTKQYTTRVKPTQETAGAVLTNICDDSKGYSFEAVRWNDGRTLIIGKDGHHISSVWLAVLDAGETLLSMMSDHERGEIEAANQRDRDAESCVDGDTVDIERAKRFGVDIVKA